MKTIRVLITVGAILVSLTCPRTLRAGTTPVQVVPQDRADRNLVQDLRGVPDTVKNLILNFDQQRDQYLRQQRLLLIRLRHATTPEERQEIRDLLQANRQEFLSDLRSFREQLRDDLRALSIKVGSPEFRRIIEAARDATTDGGHRHRGH